MADVIRTDQLAAEVNAILEEYQGTVQEVLEEAVDATAKEVVSELKATSPKRTGAYASGWTQQKKTGKRGRAYGRVAYNKTHYRLLEYGHATRNGGRTTAQSHIAPAEQKAVENFERRLKEGIQ